MEFVLKLLVFEFDMFSILACSGAIVFIATLHFISRPRAVYLVDFACFKLPAELKRSKKAFVEHCKQIDKFNEASMEFQIKALERSGMGDETYISPAILMNPPVQTTYAVVVSTENITPSFYTGNKKSMLLPNCFFRLGGAAIFLLSNKRKERRRAKYQLTHIVRTHIKGADDKSF
ncbi:hypothetical protein L7F22_049359 [Adiantum nelumboides]|nr:hypothetical protein [Adiantum nelumboides]